MDTLQTLSLNPTITSEVHGGELERVVKLRVAGGGVIETFVHVLSKENGSVLAKLASQQSQIECGHRDGRLMRLLVDGLRKSADSGTDVGLAFSVPEDFDQWRQLIAEARYWWVHGWGRNF